MCGLKSALPPKADVTNLLYTGITRGRKLVVLVGQKKAVGMAVKGKVETRRWSKLAEWMA